MLTFLVTIKLQTLAWALRDGRRVAVVVIPGVAVSHRVIVRDAGIGYNLRDNTSFQNDLKNIQIKARDRWTSLYRKKPTSANWTIFGRVDKFRALWQCNSDTANVGVNAKSWTSFRLAVIKIQYHKKQFRTFSEKCNAMSYFWIFWKHFLGMRKLAT
jgi:hypothetical protein